ncbi:ThiF family adenylyltransferase [Aeromonas veronii]|uniref:ThiF family adenylyltransferase n=1 Tax=Aeromonas veronii TaxID=654 RepID=UPI0015EBD255|nr:ThiF family adenylyltransferase [Aeromonas veronii]MBA2798694.1 ThiF family adenylyltransferase [Aeromonas veronii]
MLNKIFKVKETVDIFITENELDEFITLTFHVMTTRDRLEIKTNRNVAKFIASFNGETSVGNIIKSIGSIKYEDAKKLIDFLLLHHLIYDTSQQPISNPRFNRQVTFWDDFVLERSGTETQNILENKKIVIFGCGSIGGRIAEILVRSGVKNITIVDYKQVRKSDSIRHCYYNPSYIGKPKPLALSNFLSKINSEVKVKSYCEKLLPETDLSNYINNEIDLVINTCDEPYIGHTSLKIGRFLNQLKIPLYISGGFDAHLMSSGELIFPPLTPCIDCAQNTFSKALKEWKPIYTEVERDSIKSNSFRTPYISGGPGGLAMMSGFSANLCCIKILQFLLDDSTFDYKCERYEYLPNMGDMTRFTLKKQEGCIICHE